MFEVGNRVHFIGIGGAGMSAIAKVLLERGCTISGSDLKRSRACALLEALGAQVEIPHRASLVDGADVVVVSSAIPRSNSEQERAVELGVPVMTRGTALANLLQGHNSIIVAGTHGKTTTTSMIVSVLRSAGLDPTYLVGGGLNDAGTNAKFGRDALSVAESDESDGSFLLLSPSVAVVTNVEADHVDYWRSYESLERAFRAFIERTAADGTAVLPSSDQSLMRAAANRNVLTFGSGGDFAAENVSFDQEGNARFGLAARAGLWEVALQVPGMHNVENALAAAAACFAAGVRVEDLAAGLAAYRGVERRFEIRGSSGGVTFIDDYAHHPTEVRATLAAARPGPWKRIVAVFQPHRYSRTAALGADFGASFADADRIVVTDVYGAGEDPVPGVNGKLVADAIAQHLPGRPLAYLPRRSEVVDYVTAIVREGDVVLTLGAGDVNSVGEELLERRGDGRR
jgi:UDP-N-acetylmuramate--alanine ligase